MVTNKIYKEDDFIRVYGEVLVGSVERGRMVYKTSYLKTEEEASQLSTRWRKVTKYECVMYITLHSDYECSGYIEVLHTQADKDEMISHKEDTKVEEVVYTHWVCLDTFDITECNMDAYNYKGFASLEDARDWIDSYCQYQESI